MIGSPMDSWLRGTRQRARRHVHRRHVQPARLRRQHPGNTTGDSTPEQQADVYRLISALGAEPVDIFGSSGGAVVGLALVTAHPGRVRALVSHEPPVIELLADREQLRAQMEDIYDTYRSDGADKVMQKFLTHAGFGNAAAGDDRGALRSEPPPDQMARMRAAIEVFLGHPIRPTTRYRPDIEALRAASTRIVVGVGCEVEGTARQPSGRRARRATWHNSGRLPR